MADQGDKQKSKHQRANSKRLLSLRSRNPIKTESINSSDSLCNISSRNHLSEFFIDQAHSYFDDSKVINLSGNSKRKQSDNFQKVSAPKKTKEHSTKRSSKSSKTGINMSSNTPSSNESLDDIAGGSSNFTLIKNNIDVDQIDKSKNEPNDCRSSLSNVNYDLSYLQCSSSSVLNEEPLNDILISNISSSLSNQWPTESSSSQHSNNENEIRRLLRHDIMKNIRDNLNPHGKRNNVPRKKNESTESNKRDPIKFGESSSSSDSMSYSDICMMMDDSVGDSGKGSTESKSSISIEPPNYAMHNDGADSKLVQVIKLNSSSKRIRHNATASKSENITKIPSHHDDFLSNSFAAALDTVDSFSVPSSSSGTVASGSSAATSDSSTKDSELGRLQALLEARGIPLHVFGALGHRMQHLINRSMGNSNSRVPQLLQGLQATGDEGRQLQAVIEMCQLLVMGNEDTLIGFPVKQVVPALISLLNMEHNFEMMNNACRALTYLMEALPRSSSVVVEAVPVFLNKIQVIQCMDVAEQSLTALEMLSKWHNKAILRAKGVSICLTYLDFFSIASQRSALAITANCCQNILSNEFSLVKDSLPILSNWLTHQDEKSVESICLAFSRLVDCFQYDAKFLQEIASQNFLSNIQQLLVLTPPILNSQTFSTIMRMLALICASSPELAILLLNLNIAETLCSLLIGSIDNINDIKLIPRSHQELLEISFFICELMPNLPTDGIFSIDSIVMKHKSRKKDFVIWKWRDDSGTWQSYSLYDSRLIEIAYQSGVDTFKHIEETENGEVCSNILDLNALQKINNDLNIKRPLKRCVRNISDIPSDSSSGSDVDKNVGKLDIFKENSELVNNCIKTLFPVLYEIYCSSAGPSVRYNCLRAMLRMIYFSPPNVLEIVLKSQLISRNIAAMLASSDLRILVSTLQMSRLLIEKLPHVFGVHFIREGAMHEIRNLHEVELKARQVDSFLESFSPVGSSNLPSSSSSLISSNKPFHLLSLNSPPNSASNVKESADDSSSGSPKPQLELSTKQNIASDLSNVIPKCHLEVLAKRNIAVNSSNLMPKSHLEVLAKRNKDKDASSRKDSSAQSSSSLSSDKFDKIKDWIQEQIKVFEDFFGDIHLQEMHPAVNVLNQLTSSVSQLNVDSDNGHQALVDIYNIMSMNDISSFELINSGLIKKLFTYLTVSQKSSVLEFSALEERLRTFLNIFISAPKSRSNLDVSCLNSSPFLILIDKLNACVSHLEQFPVKVHDVSSRSLSRRGSSAVRFFNTHHLKCIFQRHPECTNLRQWKSLPVMIDPFASVHNIDQYLVSQGYGIPKGDDEEDEEDEEDEDDESDQSENSDENMLDIETALRLNTNQGSQRLQFLIGNNVLPYNMSICQAIRQYSNNEGQSSDNQDIEPDDMLGLSNIWMKTHTIFYRQMPPESSDVSDAATNDASTSRNKSDKRKRQLSDRTSHGKGNKKEEQKAIKKGENYWYDGKVPEINPFLCFVSNFSESPSVEDPSLEVIHLLKILYTLSSQWGLLYQINSWDPIIPKKSFINQKLTLKANRQLQDLISVMTGTVPMWLPFIAQEFSFLFPFQTRYLIFYVSSFDKDRALQRILDVMPEVKNNDKITPKFDKRKRTISRDSSILRQAETILQDITNSKAVLEVQYKNEVGTGLGPTLEFYAIVSKELQRADLKMWRGDKVIAQNGKGVSTSYIFSPEGLFPMPLSRNAKQSLLTRVCKGFKLLGNFLAKSIMDSRLLDIPFSIAFYKWLLDQEDKLSLSDIKYIDKNLADTVFKLEQIVSKKKEIEKISSENPSLKSAFESLNFDGCSIEDLHLDFTLPGFPDIEMRKGGKDIAVSIHNLDEYIDLLKYWIMKEGIWRQMKSFREGFESVFPLRHLQVFYPDELELLFCGSGYTKWDEKLLKECCRSDHGYTHESRAIKFLFDILCNYDLHQQRKFLQFITGSPRLPVGGLKALTPPLTIVRKTSDDDQESDNYLPSVMTCVNYLKLPDYSSIELMQEKLNIAVNEGQHSFHLS